MYTNCVKPVFDWLLALTGLVVLLPLFVVVVLLIGLTMGTSPVFCQRRIGHQGRVFWLFKFKSMTRTRDQFGRLLPDADRVTPLGYWLRRTSLDELPQLVNVLLGDMSLIGPRPLPATYALVLSTHIRHSVRPGLTGWAQVHGRNRLTWTEKFAFDTWYASHCSFRTDCLILWRTLPVLIDHSPPAPLLTEHTLRSSILPSTNRHEPANP